MIPSSPGRGVRLAWAAISLLFLLSLLLPATGFAERLGSYRIDPARVTVSGISSGAFMAGQLHIAYSSVFKGAGLVAGGLYGCAVQSVQGDRILSLASIATGPCMRDPGGLRSADDYARRIRLFESRGWIDPTANLPGERLYLFTGASDQVVNSATVRRTEDVYEALNVPAVNIAMRDHSLPPPGAGHSWVTNGYGLPCNANRDPYIDNCRYDQAGDVLKTLYGALAAPVQQLSGRFVAFEQKEFAPSSGPRSVGLNETGYLYVPAACADGQTVCGLHVVLHGCRQSAEILGDTFYKHVGINEWADSNRLIVLYPQAHSVTVADLARHLPDALFQINPEGCWNWWGYAYDSRYMLKDGVQTSAIYAMVRRIEGATGNRASP